MRLPLVCLLVCTCNQALAGGGFFSNNGATSAESTVVRAALVLEGNLTTLVVHTGFRGDADGVAWVIPTSGLGPALEAWVAPTDLFEQLHAETAPSQVRLSQKRQQLGCSESARTFETLAAPVHIDGLVARTTTIDVLGAGAAAGMPTWLSNQGYVVGERAAEIIADYVAQDSFYVVVRLDNVEEATSETLVSDTLGPVGLRMGGNVPTVPLAITAASATAPIDVELYVFATERMEPTNFAAAELEVAGWLGEGEDFDEWYAEVLNDNLVSADTPTFFVEYADFVDESIVRGVLNRSTSVTRKWFLTRMHTRLLLSQIADVQLHGTGADPSDQRFRIRTVAGGEPDQAALPTWLIGFALATAPMFWVGRRRRRPR